MKTNYDDYDSQELQRIKLVEEINQLKISPFLKPSFLGFIPVFIALIASVITIWKYQDQQKAAQTAEMNKAKEELAIKERAASLAASKNELATSRLEKSAFEYNASMRQNELEKQNQKLLNANIDIIKQADLLKAKTKELIESKELLTAALSKLALDSQRLAAEIAVQQSDKLALENDKADLQKQLILLAFKKEQGELVKLFYNLQTSLSNYILPDKGTFSSIFVRSPLTRQQKDSLLAETQVLIASNTFLNNNTGLKSRYDVLKEKIVAFTKTDFSSNRFVHNSNRLRDYIGKDIEDFLDQVKNTSP